MRRRAREAEVTQDAGREVVVTARRGGDLWKRGPHRRRRMAEEEEVAEEEVEVVVNGRGEGRWIEVEGGGWIEWMANDNRREINAIDGQERMAMNGRAPVGREL